MTTRAATGSTVPTTASGPGTVPLQVAPIDELIDGCAPDAGRIVSGDFGSTHASVDAALAEAHHVQVVPHNPLSPVSTAACIQLAACIPNFALQEYPKGEHEPPKSEIVKSSLQIENGFIIIPDAPGIGVELAPDAAKKHPYRPRPVQTRLNSDGSVMDQ